jgi:hypothetical protein
MKELHRAMKDAKDFVQDLIFGVPFERSSTCESNLFHSNDDRFENLARELAPGMVDTDDLVYESPALVAHCQDLKQTYMAIGLFIGARIADPTGRAFDELLDGWMRATLAQPRHEHLRRRKGVRR